MEKEYIIMNQDSRVKNVARNTLLGVFNNIALVLLSLISRKLFLRYIGIEYLSVGQVISNILGILAFSELGVANSVLYMLYKPVAENDTEKIARIIGSYKKINRVIGCVIFMLGMILLPFLDRLIDTAISTETVYMVFVMNLIASASTYFCSYRQVLINADQKNYIVSKVSLFTNFVSIIVQCAVIYLTHDYFAYLTVTIAAGFIQNIIIRSIAGRMYPFLKKYRTYRLGEADRKVLGDNVKSMFSVKVCGIVINNTDNILVSVINTAMVGYCANYTIISSKIRNVISVFHNSIIYSLGAASVEKSAEEKYALFKKIVLINTFLAGMTSVLLGVLWNDFIVLWIGEEYLIPELVLYSILIKYMWEINTATVWMFRDTNGLFAYVRKMLLLNAALNIMLSIILGKWIGIAGVYLATLIANIVTDFWYDARLVYRRLFCRKDSWKYNLFIFVNAGTVMAMVYGMNAALSGLGVSVGMWVCKAALSAVIYLLLFLLVYGRRNELRELLGKLTLFRLKRK